MTTRPDPCPFCGIDVSVIGRPLGMKDLTLYRVACRNLKCTSIVSTVEFGTADAAARAWNARAESKAA